MPVTDTPTPTTAPPADPIRAALDDPATGTYLTNLATRVHRLSQADAEDAVQQVFVRLLQKSDSYDAAKCTVRGWACGFLANVCHEHVRRQCRQPRPYPDLTEVAAKPGPDDTVAETREVLEACLESLGAEDRAVLEMAHTQGLTGEQIAARLGITPAAARQRLSRAFTRVKAIAKSLQQGGR